ncbi:MAG: exodeoxyribonuclease III [Bacteroidales bacterium]|nr:exodeoxyribonuclease III [Candidatus Physcousia equi]
MRFISWNVNGLRAVVNKETCTAEGTATTRFADLFEHFNADFFCLQETKMQAGQLNLEFLGYQSYWHYAHKKGYSGTAIYTKHVPLSVRNGISDETSSEAVKEMDSEGRVITLEMPDFFLVNVYTPNSQQATERGQLPRRLDYRMEWEDAFRAYLVALDQKKPVIVCGDMNVAHEEIDLKNPKTNHLSAGFTDQERQKMTELLSAGFTDSFRHFYPDATDQYSWWSYRMQARQKNVGWRIDYFLVSNRLIHQLESATIHQNIFGSDHCPVELIIKP